jgi:hypothetical protein
LQFLCWHGLASAVSRPIFNPQHHLSSSPNIQSTFKRLQQHLCIGLHEWALGICSLCCQCWGQPHN